MLHRMRLSGFDLNHVRALHFLLEEAHVARAAGRLGITPAAASNALLRLRREFDDPLLIRVGRGLVRSALAEELRAPAREVMAAAERLLDATVPFDPPTYDGMFVVAAADRICEVIAGPLDRALAARAPRAALHLRAFAGPPARGEERGLFIVPAMDHGLLAEPLFTERYAVVMRVGHPLLAGPWTVASYAAAEHILVAPRGASARGVVDDALAAVGLTRRVTRVVTSFRLALELAVSSDRVVTLPSSFLAVDHAGCVVLEPPLALPPIDMQVAWHPQQEGDPRYAWLRGVLHEVVRGLG